MSSRPFRQPATSTPAQVKGITRYAIGPATWLALALGMLFAFAKVGATEFPLISPADPPVHATVSKTDVRVAEPFVFELTVTAPAGSKVLLPSVGDLFGEFDVIDYHDVADLPSDESPGTRIWSRNMTLVSVTTGDLQVPAMEVLVTSDKEPQIFKSEPISVRVISVLEDRADPTRIRDIHSVVDVPVPAGKSSGWAWWAAGGFGLIALGTAAIALVARRKTWLTPGQWALRELETLRKSGVMHAGDGEAVTCKLTSILCDFLQMQFELVAPVQTTDELLMVIKNGNLLDSQSTRQFKVLFTMADQVKFAGLRLTDNELVQLIQSACELIDSTTSKDAAGISGASATFTADNPVPSENTDEVA